MGIDDDARQGREGFTQHCENGVGDQIAVLP
jgi:hypothetical protein